MYELLILASLMYGPWHGYLIARIAHKMIGPWAKISPGTLYPLLARLEQNGLIETLPLGEGLHAQRQVHRYAITSAGRHRFHTLMMDTSSNVGDYPRIFHLKVVHLHLLLPTERLYLIDHYINYCERTIFHRRPKGGATPQKVYASADFFTALEDVLHHLIRQEQEELAWAHCVREQAVAALNTKTP
ncbi:MAG TPA: PadR family transcriptional regulator [Ktedonobacteraceae bacterium]|nr:PadR family transcriptional regulator [Ktedonobacteraceae bacterium]